MKFTDLDNACHVVDPEGFAQEAEKLACAGFHISEGLLPREGKIAPVHYKDFEGLENAIERIENALSINGSIKTLSKAAAAVEIKYHEDQAIEPGDLALYDVLDVKSQWIPWSKYRYKEGQLKPEIVHSTMLLLAKRMLEIRKKIMENAGTLSLQEIEKRKKKIERLIMNVLALQGILQAKSYNELWLRGDKDTFGEALGEYLFMQSDTIESFLIDAMFHKLPPNARVHIPGAGRFRHGAYMAKMYGAQVTGNEISEEALRKAKKYLEEFRRNNPDMKGTVTVPDQAMDMMSDFESIIARNKEHEHEPEKQTKFDAIYFFSCTHYFDRKKLQKLLSLARQCVKPNGLIAIGVKGPSTTLDGYGIRLLNERMRPRRTHDGATVHPERTFISATYCIDGIPRFIRDRLALLDIFKESNSVGDDKSTKLENLMASDIRVAQFEFVDQVDDRSQEFLLFLLLNKPCSGISGLEKI